MNRNYYQNDIRSFINEERTSILGHLSSNNEFSLVENQKNSWLIQIDKLKSWLVGIQGSISFEYTIPRMGKRIDCVLIVENIIFILEFKVGSMHYDLGSINQTIDYALDLKNFHSESHQAIIAPILISTDAEEINDQPAEISHDKILDIYLTNGSSLSDYIQSLLGKFEQDFINSDAWFNSGYKPTPTIIEAAQALYRGHNIKEISRSDSGAINLSKTSDKISQIIDHSKINNQKSICFVTGVPGAGKTLAGLNIANSRHDFEKEEHAVFLSGNGPLVDILIEALARDDVSNAKENGLKKVTKAQAISKAKGFIQNIHHFRDDAIKDEQAPIERIVIFDEAQRAWTKKEASSFMKRKKGILNFNKSEPEFLISVMDRHSDWSVIICLIGGGQEINRGEAGLQEWASSIKESFPNWKVYVSSKINEFEYTQNKQLFPENEKHRVLTEDDLHLSVSIRSFRSENVAAFVKELLDANSEEANRLFKIIQLTYPIVITRDIQKAKKWLRTKARGSERFGIIASSGGKRLRPYAISVKNSIKPTDWFLNDQSDIRSSYYLEDVATEFDVQGLELDWTCVAWDADLRMFGQEWKYKSFVGSKWRDINDSINKQYLKNAYRVLLTRARQGMVIFIPQGSNKDITRPSIFYDETFNYLKQIGIEEINS
ncbi:MAG: DUF2075 domain-containing protein [Flavobacteriaceae bacterium]|jgi:hypothetical protein|nr:DUF2075 domain-containing protein [Flavobacteriaceae bacterium]